MEMMKRVSAIRMVVLILSSISLLIGSTASFANSDHIIEMKSFYSSPAISDLQTEAYVSFNFSQGSEFRYSRIPHPQGGYVAVFPPCDRTPSSNCLLGLSARKGNGSWIPAKLSGIEPRGLDGFSDIQFQDGSTQKLGVFSEDLSRRVMAGGKISTWSLSDFPHSLGSDYGVSVVFSTAQEGTRNKRFRIDVVPLKWNELKTGHIPGESGLREILDYSRAEFLADTEYRVQVRLGSLASLIPSWFYSRTKDSSLDAKDGILTAIARPGEQSMVQSDYFSCPHSVFRTMLSQFVRRYEDACVSARQSGTRTLFTGFAVGIDDDSEVLTYFDYLQKNLYAFRTNSAWWFESVEDSRFNPLKKCLSAPISGVGSSNAVVFPTILPKWNQETQELIYDIASTKLNAAGDANYGYFELIIEETFAKCAWSIDEFSNYKATLSITGSESNQKIETSSIALSDGYIKFRITDFGFSVPRVAVQFLRSPSAPSKNIAKAEHPSSSKKSFVCVKGKKTKILRKASVKCPKGYVKKQSPRDS
jgi:hypothetical protein